MFHISLYDFLRPNIMRPVVQQALKYQLNGEMGKIIYRNYLEYILCYSQDFKEINVYYRHNRHPQGKICVPIQQVSNLVQSLTELIA